jgi:hypothetical protein
VALRFAHKQNGEWWLLCDRCGQQRVVSNPGSSDHYDAVMIARLTDAKRSGELELFLAACPWCGDSETRESPLRCEKCEVTARELSTSGGHAYGICKHWATCILRLHPTDPRWSRCYLCGQEFPAGSASYDDLCDSCTTYGSF